MDATQTLLVSYKTLALLVSKANSFATYVRTGAVKRTQIRT